MSNRKQENNAVFAAKNVIVDENNLWMLSNDTDVLLQFDFTNMKLVDYYILPVETLMQYAHMGLGKIGNEIFIAPYLERNFLSYNCISKEIKNIDIPYESGDVKKKSKFNIVVVWKSKIVLVGHTARGIFYYDMQSRSFTKDMDYLEALKKAGCNTSAPLFSDCYYQKRNKLYIPVANRNKILEIDIEKHTNIIHTLQCAKEIRLRTIDGYEQDGKEKFLLTTVNDEMLIWSPLYGVEKMRALRLLCGSEKIYMRAFYAREKNYYIAACERKVFVETDGRIKELEFEYEERGGVNEALNGTQFEAVFRNGFDIYFQARSNGQLFKIDTVTDTIHRLDFDVAERKKKEMIKQVLSNRKISGMLKENAWFELNSFLERCV